MQLDDLINEIVELEGLLRVLRDRKAPAVRTLAEDKYHNLCAKMDQYFGAGTVASPLEDLAQATITFPEEEPAQEPAAQAPAPEPAAEAAPAVTPPPFEAIGIVEEAAEGEEQENADIQVTLAEPIVPSDQPEPQPEPEPEPEPEPTPEPEPQPAPQPREPQQPQRPMCVNDNLCAADLARAFTINDRFLFIRELFRGNADDFDQTVQVLADMPDLNEAREYLFQDLMWDSSNEAVQAFMNILVRYLPEAK